MNATDAPSLVVKQLDASIANRRRIAGFNVEEALRELETSLQDASDFIQRRPLISLGAACAVGMLGALLVSALVKKGA